MTLCQIHKPDTLVDIILAVIRLILFQLDLLGSSCNPSEPIPLLIYPHTATQLNTAPQILIREFRGTGYGTT